MIITKLIGGLGNQMFQYAAGKALALHHHTDLKLDLSGLNEDSKGAYTQRKFELDCFNIKASIASTADLMKFSQNEPGRVKRVIGRIFPAINHDRRFYESGHAYYEKFFKLPSSTWLHGFWQSEKYFEAFSKEIREDFTPHELFPAELDQYLQKINTGESVSLHVRRGDYVSLASASAFHGLLPPEYYSQSVNYILKNSPHAEIFIFSDDIEWCKENLHFDTTIHFVQHKQSAHWDLFLMSQCKHNIIANSSFSWWAAWLNSNKDKTVCIPEHWFANTKSTEIDKVPAGWNVF